ncbi:hypothetical protein BX616_002419 [Lobosporangium transversale]|uniref:Uncharacterized protein n=1 Tax=Lobosporangium transversale TaxID=64571 RepID=A0A1Y2H0R2_9FUNG|nr:hypothetical protein BCR41DRAFT_384244 [Lobosporangium transversale]KAF9901010.1 hypothetical protein BX616_002419 [Lobosporangium transversale]ORZ26652.1 hypothetical protein BCR41DRAFT_384244 [Lobosporangium transversale]|eukprot:XP_021884415.1 hypothetical protein BCR41DRAFT_384244 [Lobosporangium transversale]
MFGCIVAGRLVQTNLQQVDVNKFTFQLDDAENINHIVVFLLGTIPFQPGYAATVHLLWPNKTWQLLGMLSNEKASAIFRLKGVNKSGTSATGNDMSMDTPIGTTTETSASQITATLGISIEPIEAVLAQIANLSSSSTLGGSTSSSAVASESSNINSSAVVPLSTAKSASPDSVAAVAQKVMTHLYNHVTSFATAVLPVGSTVLVPAGGPGTAANVLSSVAAGAGPDTSYLPVKAFNDWFQNVIRKAKTDPTFLTRN